MMLTGKLRSFKSVGKRPDSDRALRSWPDFPCSNNGIAACEASHNATASLRAHVPP